VPQKTNYLEFVRGKGEKAR